jgi:uncharacterized protein (DUF1015 family)
MKTIWLQKPEPHDYPAAQSYLELLMTPAKAKAKVSQLKKAATQLKKSKDILRASSLPLLPKNNIHVQHDLKKFKKGQQLSPLLLVRGIDKLIIADGYHRICASYYLSEDLDVPCRIV